MHDLIVIGGGPAGLAAAVYALDKQLDVLLICSNLGGKIGYVQQLHNQEHPPAILGVEQANALRQRIEATPDRLASDVVVGVFSHESAFHILGEHRTWHARAVIIATGAQPTMLGVPNERQLVGHGIGYSILTHAQAMKERHVAVVGANARALRGAAELTQYAERIVLIAPHTGYLNSLLGQRLRTHPKIDLFDGYRVRNVDAVDGQVQSIVVTQRDMVQRIPVSAVFVDMGLIPNTQMVRQTVQVDRDGFVVIDYRNQTSVPGLFAAGDVTNVPVEQILMAIGEGSRAAMYAYDYILAQRLEMRASAFIYQ